jgi:hypothetical protein
MVRSVRMESLEAVLSAGKTMQQAPYNCPMTVKRFTLVAGAVAFAACSASAPDPTTPQRTNRSLGLALEPRPCEVGMNVVSPSALLSGGGTGSRHLTPRDGELRVALVLDDKPPRPVTVNWLEVPDSAEQRLPGPPWNLDLRFDSPVTGDCPVRIEFRPTPQAVSTGLRPAVTTVVLKEAPPPPPFAGQQSL